MANRNDPGVRQHETLPGLCPAPHSLTLPGGVRPVEQMVDAAIERISREHGLTYPQDISYPRELADDHQRTPSSKPTRLSWKGLEVSDEFREYAERVARGEDLPPFAGRVLAEPNAEFPWGSLARSEPPPMSYERPGRGGQLALWTSAAVVMALLAWSVALKLHAIDPPVALWNDAPPAADIDANRSDVSPNAVTSGDVGADRGDVAADLALPSHLATPDEVTRLGVGGPAASTTSAPVVSEGALASRASALPAQAPAAVGPLAPSTAPAALAVSVAPPSTEPMAEAQPASPLSSVALGVGAPSTVAPAVAAPASKPAPAPRAASGQLDPNMDFGIDELPLPNSAGAKTLATESGNVGDLARVAQPVAGPVRKEPGSESSAKGSLLVEKPSF